MKKPEQRTCNGTNKSLTVPDKVLTGVLRGKSQNKQ